MPWTKPTKEFILLIIAIAVIASCLSAIVLGNLDSIRPGLFGVL